MNRLNDSQRSSVVQARRVLGAWRLERAIGRSNGDSPPSAGEGTIAASLMALLGVIDQLTGPTAAAPIPEQNREIADSCWWTTSIAGHRHLGAVAARHTTTGRYRAYLGGVGGDDPDADTRLIADGGAVLHRPVAAALFPRIPAGQWDDIAPGPEPPAGEPEQASDG